jgi:hypothetical protein
VTAHLKTVGQIVGLAGLMASGSPSSSPPAALVGLDGRSLPPSGAHAEGQGKPLTIIHPERPTDGVLTRSASCGARRFSITIASAGRGSPEKVQSLSVNGREVARREKAKVTNLLSATSYITDTAIPECSRISRASARLRLDVIDKPWSGSKARYLDFWVSPSGEVSGVKFN